MKFFHHKIYIFTFAIVLALIFIIFPFVFSYFSISGGDYTYLSSSYLVYIFHNSFSSWISTYNFGQNTTALLNYAPFNIFVGCIASLVNWNGILVERIVWWIPFFILAFIGHFYMRKLLPFSKTGILSTFIFLFNTYTLMLLGGGQISGVGLAYIISPIVLVTFIELINASSLKIPENLNTWVLLKKSFVSGLFFSMQAIFDIRFAYVTLCAIFLYAVFKIVLTISKKNTYVIPGFILLYCLIIPLGITALIHSFWLLPTIIFHQNPIAQLGPGYNSVKAVQYFSFAKFEDTISLLHPNWPENVFGFVHFMRPEFLLLPVLAYASLLFIKPKDKDQKFTNQYILFFALLGLVGAFLAKGTNDPFGGVYIWLFQHFPGFFMFRDSTKWYVLQIISYGALIPTTIFAISEIIRERIKGKVGNLIPFLLLCIFMLYVVILILPAVSGKLSGTFRSESIPHEYVQLNSFISSQPDYFRTLWLPTRQKYGIYSVNHPALSANDLFQIATPKDLIKEISSKNTESMLKDSSIRYIIVPEDTDGTMYLTDRKFDRRQYEFYVASLQKLSWLKEINSFGDNKVFAIADSKSHFWSPNNMGQILAIEIGPTKYSVSLSNAKKGQLLVFSEKYDSLWYAQVANKKLQSQKYRGLYNSFVLPKNGNYTIIVTYEPQVWIRIGLVISVITFVLVLGSLYFFKNKSHL